MRNRWTAGLLTAAVAVTLVLPGAAVAGSKGRKNTAIGLTGVAAYQLLKGKTTTGLVAGAGAAYAWKRHRDARKAEKRRARSARLYRARRYARTSSRYRTRYR
jgi:hypothetical protein